MQDRFHASFPLERPSPWFPHARRRAGAVRRFHFRPRQQAGRPSPPTKVPIDLLMAPQALPDLWIGDANAPITMIEYASMTCSHCARFQYRLLPRAQGQLHRQGQGALLPARIPARSAGGRGRHAGALRGRQARGRWSSSCSSSRRTGLSSTIRSTPCRTPSSRPAWARRLSKPASTTRACSTRSNAVREEAGQEVPRHGDADLLHQWRQARRRNSARPDRRGPRPLPQK